MAKVFISHSSKNKEFVRRLASDLAELGHTPWLDEWEIKVGECIVTRIEHGVAEANYVVIVLSQHSVKSGWVEREWKSKYWEEIERGETLILPVLVEDCEIPQLLKTKRYANFRQNYSVGLVELMGAISPTIQKHQATQAITALPLGSEISALIAKVYSKLAPLSQCMAEALDIAQRLKISVLYNFCASELSGWNEDRLREYTKEQPGYRYMEVFASPTHYVNSQFFGLINSPSAVLDYLRTDKENFIPLKMIFPHPVSEVENKATFDPSNCILQIRFSLKVFLPDTEYPDAIVHAYCSADTFAVMLDSIRNELTRQLIDLLPGIDAT